MIKNFGFIIKQSRDKGISLIETVVYLGLFSALFVLILNYAMAVGESNRKANIKNTFGRADIFLSEHLEDTIENAVSLNEGSSVLSSDNGVLNLNTSSGFVEYILINNRIQVNIDGDTNYLTELDIEVTKLRFEKIVDDSNATIGIQVDLLLESEKESELTRDIKTTFSL